MTGPCSGTGVGVAKAGFSALQYVGPGAIGGALAGLSGWQGAAVGAAIGALTYELATFCPGGPPAQPTFTVADVAALLTPITSPDYIAAAAKFRDFLGAVFWPVFCECSGGTSVAPAPSTYPSGGPQVQPSGSGAPTPCLSLSHLTFTGSLTTPNDIVSMLAVHGKPQLLHAHIDTTTAGSGPFSTLTLQFSYTPQQFGTRVNFGAVRTIVANQVYDFYEQLPVVDAYSTQITATWVSGTNGTSTFTTLENFCNGGPFAATPCCPPDNALQAQLDQILSMITLIQRQAVPFAYVPGTVHTGLSGNGTISINGLIGAKVDVTTLPSRFGLRGASPVEYFNLGFITFGTADGFPSSYTLDHDPMLLLPARCSAYTELDYDLSPGLVVTITELLREP
jgi:hypothetical protein